MHKEKQSAGLTVRFSIGAKLITLISLIVVMSLGSITALVSWLVRSDLRISAEENNFEINRRSATEAGIMLENALSHSQILMQTIAAMGAGNKSAEETADFFFVKNPQIAAVFLIAQGEGERVYANRRFFASQGIDVELAGAYFSSQRDALGRAARGEAVILNAAPDFVIPVLALFFPWRNGAGGVLYSSEELNQSLGFGTNQSYMVNSGGGILSHADFSLLRANLNLGGDDYIRSVLDSPQKNRQQLIEQRADLTSASDVVRKFAAFTKLDSGAVVITCIEYDKVFEGIRATTRRNIYLTAAVLCVSIIFIWLFSKSMSLPLKALTAVAHEIEGGVFDMELKPKGRDEIGVLTGSFQKMCAALGIFGKFTNREIAVKAMRGEIQPGGLRKHATIFFSDIRGFTAKSEGFTNEFGEGASDRIIHWLNQYFTEMIHCVEKTNGVVDKFIGDAVMAHWGTAYSSGSPERDAYNCVCAALMMRKALYDLNKKRAPGDTGDPEIVIGCGINSGLVTAGQLGSDMRMEYTVIGDPVNLASRIEALTKPLAADILISEDTWRLTGSRFITEEMPSVTVKGKEKPVRIFAVVNLKGAGKGPQTLAQVRRLLNMEAPDISKTDVNKDEKKYKIGEG